MEITVRIWRCEECGDVHIDCPQLEELNDPEWSHVDVESALLELERALNEKGFLDN